MTILNTATLVRRVDSQVELLSPTVNTALILPSTPNMVGKVWTVVNSGTANVLVQAADASLVRTVYPSTTGQVTPNTDAPTTAAQWEGVGIVTSNVASLAPTMSAGTPTFSNLSTGAKWWRNGDQFYMKLNLIGSSGNGTAGLVSMTMPFGLVIDTTKYGSVNNNSSTDGYALYYNGSGGGSLTPSVFSTTVVGFLNGFAGAGLSGSVIASTGQLGCFFNVPIVGWSATKG